MTDQATEIAELEREAAWRLRLVDADPNDTASAAAARLLEKLAADLGREDNGPLWIELGSLCNWLGESDTISDYAGSAAEYRRRIGVSAHPGDGAAYLRALLAIGRGLIG